MESRGRASLFAVLWRGAASSALGQARVVAGGSASGERAVPVVPLRAGERPGEPDGGGDPGAGGGDGDGGWRADAAGETALGEGGADGGGEARPDRLDRETGAGNLSRVAASLPDDVAAVQPAESGVDGV